MTFHLRAVETRHVRLCSLQQTSAEHFFASRGPRGSAVAGFTRHAHAQGHNKNKTRKTRFRLNNTTTTTNTNPHFLQSVYWAVAWSDCGDFWLIRMVRKFLTKLRIGFSKFVFGAENEAVKIC